MLLGLVDCYQHMLDGIGWWNKPPDYGPPTPVGNIRTPTVFGVTSVKEPIYLLLLFLFFFASGDLVWRTCKEIISSQSFLDDNKKSSQSHSCHCCQHLKSTVLISCFLDVLPFNRKTRTTSED